MRNLIFAKMKYFLVALIFQLFAANLQAQVLTIISKDTRNPLSAVAVISQNPPAQAFTDANGKTDITAFKGSKLIEIRMTGFVTQRLSYADLEAAEFTVKLFRNSVSLNQVVISALRWNQNKRTLPTRITSVTTKDVTLQNPQTTADLLGNSGEVFIQKSQQGGGSPMIRGFATNRLLYSVDGVRMNTAIFRSGNIQNVISLDPFAIESTEIFFGPGSVAYGSDAIGGVMSFQTLTPVFSSTNKVKVNGNAAMRYATANQEQTAHVDVNLGWKKWAAVSSISNNNFSDLRMGSDGPDEYLRPFVVRRVNGVDELIENEDPRKQVPTGYGQINLMQKIRFSPNEFWDIQYGIHYSETSEYGRYDRLIRLTDTGLPQSAEWNYGPQKWVMNNFAVNYKKPTAIFDEVALRLAHQFFAESRIDRRFNSVTRAIRSEEVDAYSVNLDFNKSSGKNHFYYGLEWVMNDVTSKGSDVNVDTGVETSGPSRYPDATWLSSGIYGNYRYDLSNQWTINTGARYNQFGLEADFRDNLPYYPLPVAQSTSNEGALTGSLGAAYTPGELWAISTNLSTGFRAPNVDDMGKVFDSEQGSVVVPNTALRAEYAYNAEIGVARVFGSHLKVDFTTYYTLLTNALVRRDFTLNGMDSIVYDGIFSQVQAVQNASEAYVYGVQVHVEVKLDNGFGLSSHFNFQKGEEEMDNGTISPSRHAAPWFGLTRLHYESGKLQLQIYGQYSGGVSFANLNIEEQGKPEIYAINADGNPFSPSWFTLNFKSAYQISRHISAGLGLENITDQRYRPYSSGIVAPGRNLILSLRASF